MVLLGLLAAACCRSEPGGQQKTEQDHATAEMAMRLAVIANHLERGGSFMGMRNRIESMKKQLASSMEGSQAIDTRLNLARSLLNYGRTPEAIELFEENNRIIAADAEYDPVEARQMRELLAISYLRQGEQENCIKDHNADRCLFPIKDGGVYTITQTTRLAVAAYAALLDDYPEDLNYRWLLNIAYMALGEYPNNVPSQWLLSPQVFASDYEIDRFHDVAAGAGVDCLDLAGGCVIDDLNGDGYLDLLVSSWGAKDQLRYLENNGDGTFAEHIRSAGIRGEMGGLNLTHADYDNDGDLDVLVLRGAWLGQYGEHPNSLLRNNGDGTFSDVTRAAGLFSLHPTQTAAWGDFDNDGWLDLFIGNESSFQTNHPSELFHNNGDGTFTDVARQVGLNIVSFVKAAVWGDYNNDGYIDLFLSCLNRPNLLFRNDGPPSEAEPVDVERIWSFTEIGYEAGVSEPRRSFPAWFFDFNNDGWLDIFIADYDSFDANSLARVVADYLRLPDPNAFRSFLYENNHDGTFTNRAPKLGLDRVFLAMGANFGDIDNDGWLDLYIGSGEPDLRTLVPNRMFRNDRGKRFQDVTTSGGFGHLQKGHGIAFGDIDNDGDQDVYAVMGGAFEGDVFQNALYLNPGSENHWITLILEGRQANRSAIGARVRVVIEAKGKNRELHRVVNSGGSFGSSSLQLEIGLGQASGVELLEIIWPGSSEEQQFTEVPMDRFYRVIEGDESLHSIERQQFTFKTAAAGHDHH